MRRVYRPLLCLALVVVLFFSQSILWYIRPLYELEPQPHTLPAESTRPPPLTPLPPSTSKDYHDWNAQILRDLDACIAANTCGPNQQKIALLAAHWFQEAVVGSFRGGEGIWAISVVGDKYLALELLREPSLV